MSEHSSKVTPESILERIVAAGGRRTMSRQAVIRVIVDSHGHSSADEIATRVQQDFPSVDVSTVYRTLETLRGLEIVDRVYFPDGNAVYHLRDHEHHHLCCEKCGSIKEVPVSVLKGLEIALLEDFGFDLHARPLGLFGLCEKCRDTSADLP